MVALLCFFLTLLASPFKSSSRLEAENAALRHQLIVLQRKVRGRVHFTNSDRLFFIQLYRANPAPGVPLPIGIKPVGDKLVRMEAQCARFEAGQVYLPREAPWLSEFLHEILAFPNSRYDDQIDSVSQFLKRAEANEATFAMVATAVKIFQNAEVIADTTNIDHGSN